MVRTSDLSPASPRDVSRRAFIQTAGRGTAAAFVGSSLLWRMKAADSAPAFLASTDPTDDPLYMSATKLAGLIRAKKISAVEAVKLACKRIDEVNPKINAVVQRCYERALTEAAAADAALARGELKGALHGVPFTIKDSLDTEGVITTGGTVGRMHHVPKEDATVVARVRAAGAILLGKTNTPEWTLAGGGITGISTTANIIYGLSRNPYDLTRSTSGSSGGAGAIVAAGGASFDIGSDFGGSIRGPAHNNGIAGIKPTFGRVPRTGHIVDYGGTWDSWQEIGPLTRRVEDLALIMPLLSGPDFKDAAMMPVPWKDPATVVVAKLRVAFFPTNGVADTSPETQDAVKACATYFSQAGAKVTEDCPKDLIMELEETRLKFIQADGWAFTKRLAEKWGSKSVSASLVGRYDQGTTSTAELIELWEKQDANRVKFLQWMKNYDVVLCPAAGKPALPIDQGPQPMVNFFRPGASYTGMFNTTGYPSAVVRAGTSPEKLPIGVMVTGQLWRDEVVIAACGLIEAKTGGWQRPPI